MFTWTQIIRIKANHIRNALCKHVNRKILIYSDKKKNVIPKERGGLCRSLFQRRPCTHLFRLVLSPLRFIFVDFTSPRELALFKTSRKKKHWKASVCDSDDGRQINEPLDVAAGPWCAFWPVGRDASFQPSRLRTDTFSRHTFEF